MACRTVAMLHYRLQVFMLHEGRLWVGDCMFLVTPRAGNQCSEAK
jgi:hypothetical protein